MGLVESLNPNWSPISIENITLDEESIKENLARPVADALFTVKRMLSSGLTLADNMNVAILTVTCTHGVEAVFKNPLRNKPIGVYVLGATGTDQAQTLQSVDGSPKLNMARTDGLMGITVQYAPPLGLISLYNTANQPINNVTVAPITWDAEIAKVGALAHSNTVNPTRITCNAAGSVLLTFNGAFQAAAAGTRSCWTGKNGDSAALNRRRGAQSAPGVAPANYFSSSISGDALWEVSVGDYLEVFGYQDSGGALNFRGGGGSENSLAWAQYVAPDPSTTARVTFVLVGG